MSSPLSADMLTAIEDRIVDMLLDILKGVVDAMQVDGYVYGDVKLDREQRILAFHAAMQSGELNSLIVVNPDLARKMAAQYQRDIAASPVYAGGD